MMSGMSLCVVGSGSSGNCSVVVVHDHPRPWAFLVDIGIAPESAGETLRSFGLSLGDVTDVLVTHFDGDHYNSSCFERLPDSVRLRYHCGQVDRARKAGVPERRSLPFSGIFSLGGIKVHPLVLHHDLQGSVAFRICHEVGDLGFVTDCGQATGALIDHMRDVAVLAIESNYDREMELGSPRPWFLKRRIMGGKGHLSNDQAHALVRAIRPQRGVVLLHLSELCNDPGRVRALYDDEDVLDGCDLVLSNQDKPTRWVGVENRGEGSRETEIVRRALGL